MLPAMRHLILMRHAKTEGRNPGGDHARQLVARGVEDCALIVRFLHDQSVAPAYALVSDAARTRETMAAMQPAMSAAAGTAYLEELYLAEAEQILHEICSVPDTHETLLVIGHNPGMHELAFLLAGHGDRRLRRELTGSFPTAATAILSFDVAHWNDVQPRGGTLQYFVTAKSLRVLHPDDGQDQDDAD